LIRITGEENESLLIVDFCPGSHVDSIRSRTGQPCAKHEFSDRTDTSDCAGYEFSDRTDPSELAYEPAGRYHNGSSCCRLESTYHVGR
jgi:hypothetical protein